MQVIVATDGSKASLVAAQQFKSFADPSAIEEVVVVAVVSPLAVVPFENELSVRTAGSSGDALTLGFEAEARAATAALMEVFEGWGPAVSRRLRSGSPASEIIKVAEELPADLIVVAAGGRGLTSTILIGSTASKLQHSAPCAVLVGRRAPHAK
jgi:nucleotide-binding universal stress UspA family protein